jgi:8-oxo-dGTP pyrophosphatase MutT (NUDIX family)
MPEAHLHAILIRMAAVRRICAKVLLIDSDGRVLLFSGIDRTLPNDPPVWFPVGGAVEAGETLEAAAIRETREETGFEIDDVGPALFTCRFEWVFEGSAYDQEETYFLVRVPGEPPMDGGWTEVEKATVVGHRWWAIADLHCTQDTVHPDGLADLLDRFL